jgi:imidazolonepropionase-like amidohydrolase
MNGEEVIESATVLIEGDRITSVGTDVVLPANTKVFDATGMTVMPGLIDVHAHLHFSALDVLPEQEWRYFANLAYGVTTVHDPSAFSENVFAFAEMVETGAMWGPRVFSTGQILYGASGAFRSEIATREDAGRHMLRMKQLGAISVKSYQQPRRDQRQWLVEAGREEGMLVVPEGGGDLFNNTSMVLDGHTSIEHSLPVAPVYDDILTVFGASGLGYSPTLLVSYGGPFGENFFFSRDKVWANEKLQRFTPRSVLDPKARRPALRAPEGEWFHQDVAVAAATIARRGGLVTLGAHGQLQGLGAHWELWALAGPGAMTPMEALRAATISGATYLGMDDDLGSVQSGKLADLLVLTKDPLENIENSDSLRWVIKNGAVYDAETMDRLWPDPAPRPTLLWERE